MVSNILFIDILEAHQIAYTQTLTHTSIIVIVLLLSHENRHSICTPTCAHIHIYWKKNDELITFGRLFIQWCATTKINLDTNFGSLTHQYTIIHIHWETYPGWISVYIIDIYIDALIYCCKSKEIILNRQINFGPPETPFRRVPF